MGDWLAKQLQRNVGRRKPRKPRRSGATRQQQTGRSTTGSGVKHSGGTTPQGDGSCPLRRMGKPLGGLLALAADRNMQCPAAIIKARAAVARLKPVRQLRPQALPTKLLAIGAFTGVVNFPSGIARAHVEKFSPEWFVAVHATIPFIAMLRKAVLMPKWAIAWTVASAVIGQVMGARFERERIAAREAAASAGSGSDGRTAASRGFGSLFPGGASFDRSPAQTCGRHAAKAAPLAAWQQVCLVPAAC